jgi:putative FmdB family regulatory protein
MPIYEYQCKKCGNEFDYLVLGGDDAPERCPSCKGKKITRLLSVCSFVSKGKGGQKVKSSASSCSGCSSTSCSSCSH